MWSYCPEYPGAEICEVPQPAFLPDDFRVYLQKFVIGGQTGTYIETKAHADQSSAPVVDLPLEEFMRPVVVIHAGDKGPLEPVTLADVEPAAPDIRQGDAVLLRTGWDLRWDEPDFIESSPYVEREAALWLIGRGIGLMGSDFPRFDNPELMQFPWDEYWERVNLVLAPVVNLTGLSGRCGTLIAFPLKIQGACSTPCRAAIVMG